MTVVVVVSSRPARRGGIGSESTVVSLGRAENGSTLARHKDVRVVGDQRLTFRSVTGRPRLELVNRSFVTDTDNRDNKKASGVKVFVDKKEKRKRSQRTYMIAASPPTIRLALTP